MHSSQTRECGPGHVSAPLSTTGAKKATTGEEDHEKNFTDASSSPAGALQPVRGARRSLGRRGGECDTVAPRWSRFPENPFWFCTASFLQFQCKKYTSPKMRPTITKAVRFLPRKTYFFWHNWTSNFAVRIAPNSVCHTRTYHIAVPFPTPWRLFGHPPHHLLGRGHDVQPHVCQAADGRARLCIYCDL